MTIPTEWEELTLPQDPPSPLDLFPSTYRITRSIGGSWTELLHTESEMLTRARSWGTRLRKDHRVCPLCFSDLGDTRHVILSCRYTANW